MKVSGFYMGTGVDIKDAEKNIYDTFKEEISHSIQNIYGEHNFEVIEVIRTEEFDIENEKAYDVHFLLNIPQLQLVEDTVPFYDLERLVFIGLGIVDEEVELQ